MVLVWVFSEDSGLAGRVRMTAFFAVLISKTSSAYHLESKYLLTYPHLWYLSSFRQVCAWGDGQVKKLNSAWAIRKFARWIFAMTKPGKAQGYDSMVWVISCFRHTRLRQFRRGCFLLLLIRPTCLFHHARFLLGVYVPNLSQKNLGAT